MGVQTAEQLALEMHAKVTDLETLHGAELSTQGSTLVDAFYEICMHAEGCPAAALVEQRRALEEGADGDGPADPARWANESVAAAIVRFRLLFSDRKGLMSW